METGSAGFSGLLPCSDNIVTPAAHLQIDLRGQGQGEGRLRGSDRGVRMEKEQRQRICADIRKAHSILQAELKMMDGRR